MKHLLFIYGRGSGQEINMQKSSMFLSANTLDNVRRELMGILAIPNLGVDKYLGLPSLIDKSRVKAFNFICEKV